MNELRQGLYLIADEMRGMGTLSRTFAASVYEKERAHRMMELAADVAALAEGEPVEEVRALFEAEPWLRASPALGVDAAVFDAEGRILLIQRKDNGRWALPGGIAEIGSTPAEAVLRELWEEAGLRGDVTRLLGLFDNRRWHGWSKVHMWHLTFLVNCADLAPVPGSECLAARFFAPEALPSEMHSSHGPRLVETFAALRTGTTYFDPGTSVGKAMPMGQRPGTTA
ncbi:MAG TPA: NUDIX domain-containing protein [Thermomicrobiales bacterium]|jgi:ADP-ribose pyrophosphatase YjhB (NUDIX family)